jgi:hypothetical protein
MLPFRLDFVLSNFHLSDPMKNTLNDEYFIDDKVVKVTVQKQLGEGNKA